MNKEINTSENNFEQCIKCTICTVYCPVMAVNPDYPGPKQAGPDGERYRLKDPGFFDEALKYCMNCKRCEVACPSNVKIGDIIQKARLDYSAKKPGLREFALANTDLMGGLATTFAPVVNGTLKLGVTKSVMDGLAIDKHRTFPSYSGQKFTTWFKRNAKARQENYDKFVTYFHGCYANYNYPKLAKDFVKVLNALGYGVHLMDKEKCCGVALISNGFREKAKKQAENNLAQINGAVAAGEPVLATSSTCTFTIRDEYEHILGLDNSNVRDSVMLATRFIFNLVDSGKARLVFRNDYRKRIAYHTPCHMEKLGWSIYSVSLLKMIPGVDFVMLDSQCCGIAGTYGFKKENYPFSQKIGGALFRQISEIAPDFVATDCETCKWQIEMSTEYMVENPISVIADALDVEATVATNRK
ncbi:MAG: anaerobic glycerol-3-phosphate dehydrogenase subunit GlpC [Candidatus Cryptobacteroides sp.]